MKLKNLFILPVVLVLGACSATYTPETDQSSNYDFSSIKTFNVIGDKNIRNPMISDIDRERIDTAVANSLTEQGKQVSDEESADVLVSYFVVTKDKVKVNSTHSGYYGRFAAPGYGRLAHVSTRNYVEGTLVIDVIDNYSKKSVWRSTLTKSIKNYDTADKREQAINNAMQSVFNTFPSNHPIKGEA